MASVNNATIFLPTHEQLWILEYARSAIRFNYHIFGLMKITLIFLQILHRFPVRIIVIRMPPNLHIQKVLVWHRNPIFSNNKNNSVCFYLKVAVANYSPNLSEVICCHSHYPTVG